jgi:hypothetical protein
LPALADGSAFVSSLVAAAAAGAGLARLQELTRCPLDPIRPVAGSASPPQLGDLSAPAADANSLSAAKWYASHVIISSEAGVTRVDMIIAYSSCMIGTG